MNVLARAASVSAALLLFLPAGLHAQEPAGESKPPAAVRTRPSGDSPKRVAVPRRPTRPVRAAERVRPAEPKAGSGLNESQERQRGRTARPRDRDQRGRTARPDDRGRRVDPGGRGSRGWRRGPFIGSRPVYGRPSYVVRPRGGRHWYARRSFYDPYWSRSVIAWNPLFYAPWGLVWSTAGHWGHIGSGYPGWGYPGSYGASTFDTGSVRLQMRPRDAEVIVDGYYAGRVDDFDGVFQSIRLAPGGHTIEVRMPGYETSVFDVHVQPGRTLTIKEVLREVP